MCCHRPNSLPPSTPDPPAVRPLCRLPPPAQPAEPRGGAAPQPRLHRAVHSRWQHLHRWVGGLCGVEWLADAMATWASCSLPTLPRTSILLSPTAVPYLQWPQLASAAACPPDCLPACVCLPAPLQLPSSTTARFACTTCTLGSSWSRMCTPAACSGPSQVDHINSYCTTVQLSVSDLPALPRSPPTGDCFFQQPFPCRHRSERRQPLLLCTPPSPLPTLTLLARLPACLQTPPCRATTASCSTPPSPPRCTWSTSRAAGAWRAWQT